MASVEYKFKIDVRHTPETMPLQRLVRYLNHLSIILGEPKAVHLIGIEGGSTTPVLKIDGESLKSVERRTVAVRNNEGPKDAREAKAAIERDLVEDDARGGELLDESGARVLYFAGRGSDPLREYGPFQQPGTLDGILLRVGNETANSDPVSVLMRSTDGPTLVCRAHEEVARRLIPYWLNGVLRVSGTGQWIRRSDGRWDMRKFLITDFDPLKGDSLTEVVERMRQIPAAWKSSPDPIGDLMAMRSDDLQN